jgi:hypothetical protein
VAVPIPIKIDAAIIPINNFIVYLPFSTYSIDEKSNCQILNREKGKKVPGRNVILSQLFPANIILS